MNRRLHELLEEQAATVQPPTVDVAVLVAEAQRRERRRRLTVAASCVAIVAIVAAGSLSAGLRSADRGLGPTNIPNTNDRNGAPRDGQVRQLVYEDIQHVETGNGLGGSTIHFGDHVIENDVGMVHLDVTDDGFVYTSEDGPVWFSDGGQPEQIGTHACGRGGSGDPGMLGAYETNSVMTGNAGSLVVWFDCTPGTQGTLVVFDTDSGHEVIRQQIAACHRRELNWCSLTAVVGDHVYFLGPAKHGRGRVVGPLVRFDVTTGRESVVTAQAYADDLRSQPRGLVVGDSWQAGTPTSGIGESFNVVGSRLVPGKSIFDTATGHAVRLHLPNGYDTDADAFTLHEWLDDDTVALAGGGGWTSFDLITCRLSDGRCTLAAKGHEGSWVRIVPQVVLPG